MNNRSRSNTIHFDLPSEACIYLIDYLTQLNDDQIDENSLSVKEDEIILKLEKEAENIKKRKSIILNPKNAIHLYEYISAYFKEYPEKKQTLLSRLSFKRDIVYKIEKKTIKIKDINPSLLAIICQSVSLNINDAIELIKQSIKLNVIGNSTANSMARYSYNKDLGDKDRSMQKGLNELLLKANNNLVVNSANNTDRLIDEYIENFKKNYNK